jgi:hypothetical protein
MASLDEKIADLVEKIEGYEMDLKRATSHEDIIQLRGLIQSRSDNLTRLS